MSKYMFGFEDKGITMATEAGQPDCARTKNRPCTATRTHRVPVLTEPVHMAADRSTQPHQ